MNRPTAPVFLEAVLLGVALLNGGNRTVQVSTVYIYSMYVITVHNPAICVCYEI